MVNSAALDGLTPQAAREKIIGQFETQGRGQRRVNFRLRDWGISRQRYWGCPIPIILCDTCGAVPVPRADLPVTLPEDVSFDRPGNPLVHHPTAKQTSCPNAAAQHGAKPIHSTHLSIQAGILPCFTELADDAPTRAAAVNHWLPVDQYIGGIEHAILHLLYARLRRQHEDRPFGG